MPENLLLLSGISAFTFAAAKGITASNVSTAGQAAEEAARRANPNVAPAAVAAAVTAAEGTIKPQAAQPRFPSDLLNDDRGRPDIGDVQMLIITSLAVVVYFAMAFKFLGSVELLKVVTLPDVDTTILAAYGFGKGTYVAKKYVSGGRAEA